MIKHIVMWKLKENHNGVGKLENALRLKKELEDLKSSISEIREIEVGLNLSESDASCDVVLYSTFNSIDDLKTYQKHPDHLKVAEFLSDLRTERRVVDYEA